MSRLGVRKKFGGGTARTDNSNWPKGYSIPYDVMLSNKSLGEEGRKEGEDIWSYGVCLPKLPLRVTKMAKHLPADGTYWINSLFWFPCMCSFCFPSWTVLILTHGFLPFCPSHSSPHATSGESAGSCVGLSSLLGLTPNRYLKNQASLPNSYWFPWLTYF